MGLLNYIETEIFAALAIGVLVLGIYIIVYFFKGSRTEKQDGKMIKIIAIYFFSWLLILGLICAAIFPIY